MSNLFSDGENNGHDRDKVELTRKAMADNGGMVLGSGQMIKSKEVDSTRQKEDSLSQQMTALQIMMQDPDYAAAYS